MPFDVLDFIPPPEVREECRRVGKVFTTHEKAMIVSWSDKPMQEQSTHIRPSVKRTSNFKMIYSCLLTDCGRC